MEHALVAPFDGVVGEISVSVGDQVTEGTVLAKLTASRWGWIPGGGERHVPGSARIPGGAGGLGPAGRGQGADLGRGPRLLRAARAGSATDVR